MTYFRVQDLPQWHRFVEHVRCQQRAWKVKHWCTTLESTKTGRWHIHLMLQFERSANRSSRTFCFENLIPRADATDLLGGGFCKKKMQESLNRGMFYCWADKVGTVRDEEGKPCVQGNYLPAWTGALYSYPVKSRWAEELGHESIHNSGGPGCPGGQTRRTERLGRADGRAGWAGRSRACRRVRRQPEKVVGRTRAKSGRPALAAGPDAEV